MHQKTSWTIQNVHHGLAFDWRVYAFRCAQKHFQFFRIRTVWISTNARTKFFWKCSRPFFKDTQSPKLNHKICIFSGVFSSDISFDCIFSPLFLISLFFYHIAFIKRTANKENLPWKGNFVLLLLLLFCKWENDRCMEGK